MSNTRFPIMKNTKEWPNSSNIESAEYNEETQVLTITFIRGAKYAYAGVPVETWLEFHNQDSPGTFFHNRIREHFDYQKV